MDRIRWGACARCAAWWIERNPAYLMSAACMAVGAKLYLDAPTARAGDIGLILLTLGILQVYEAVVAGILVLLHRSRRSPEDEPSLLLVAAVCWTGPMAATIEMTARQSELGLLCAVGAAAIALSELWTVKRALALRLSFWTQLMAAACLVLLTGAPRLLRIPPGATGANELYLYSAWWLLAGIALLGLGAARRGSAQAVASVSEAGTRFLAGNPQRSELYLAGILLLAMAVHLIGMNHAFFGHARLFYASPLIVALAWILLWSCGRPWLVRGAALLPAAAIVLAMQGFHPDVPAHMLPAWLRDPLPAISLMAAGAWWLGFRRHRLALLLHAANAAIAFGLLKAVPLIVSDMPSVHFPRDAGDISRDSLALLLGAAAVYFLLTACVRRSTIEAVASLGLTNAAIAVWVWERDPAGVMLIALTTGWCVWLSMHVITRRAWTAWALLPIAFLMGLGWIYEFDPLLRDVARAHAALLIGALLAAGLIWPATRYGPVSGVVALAHLAFFSVRWIVQGPQPVPGLIVLGAFVLLAAGVLTSWNKHRLLASKPSDNIVLAGGTVPVDSLGRQSCCE